MSIFLNVKCLTTNNTNTGANSNNFTKFPYSFNVTVREKNLDTGEIQFTQTAPNGTTQMLISKISKNYIAYGIVPTTNTSVKTIMWGEEGKKNKIGETTANLNNAKYTWKADTIALTDRSLDNTQDSNSQLGRVNLTLETKWSASVTGSDLWQGNRVTLQDDIYLESSIKHSTSCFGDKQCKIEGAAGTDYTVGSENRKKLENSERLKDFGEGIESSFSLDKNRSNAGSADLLKNSGETRNVKLASKNNKSIDKYNGTSNVWILSHGWNGELGTMDDIASGILSDPKTKDDIVLILDWRQASHTGLPCQSSTWTEQISENVKSKLNNWGLNDSSKVNLVGHSMGTILSTEIGKRFGKVDFAIMLEPPSDVCGGGYNVNDPSGVGNETKKSNLDNAAGITRSLVGKNSAAGSQEHARTANKSIQVDFDTLTTNNAEHGWVQEAFARMINVNQSPTDRLQDDTLGTVDKSKHDSWESSGWGPSGWEGHYGKLYMKKKSVPLNPNTVSKVGAGEVELFNYREFGIIKPKFKL